MMNKNILLLAALVGMVVPVSAQDTLLAKKKEEDKFTRIDALRSPTRGKKEAMTIKRGDSEFTIGGKTKFESFLKENTSMLNSHLPDECEYFKGTADVTFDFAYGQEKYDYKAVEFFMDMRYKGIWGRAMDYADKESGPVGPSNVKFESPVRFAGSNTEAIFGPHSHVSGKSLLWLKDAWLNFSLNAAFGSYSQDVHNLKLGWFPFDLGRGIALGGYYGLNKELLGFLYNSAEEKSAPGINLHGTIVKDRVDYDLYYSRLEERGKSLSDTLTLEKRHIVGRNGTPWRGVAKDVDLFAARMNLKPFLDHRNVGTIEIEPYVFYNAASDQTLEYDPDVKAQWGAYGFSLEQSYKDFEWGGECAFNYGKEKVYNIDRNHAVVMNDNGYLVEQYNHLLYDSTHKGNFDAKEYAKVTAESKRAAQQPVYTNNTIIGPVAVDKVNNLPAVPSDTYKSDDIRFRPAYTNKLDGWMLVVDGAYNLKKADLKLALAYGYASGDTAPHRIEKDKTYHGFVGLNEQYNGTRVTSIIMLDERSVKRPVGLAVDQGGSGKIKADQDTSFTDLQLVGFGATWKPKCRIKGLSLNPNVLGFWKAHESYKVITTPGTATTPARTTVDTPNKARSYMGTELNILGKCTVITDLTMFANFAVFIPGGYYADVKGVPLSGDYFDKVVQDDRNEVLDASQFRLSDDTAYHLNIGFEYKF
jgi:hypothetical protein